ncbi:MAG: hypothetical protein IAE91_15435 [Ignavibacteriaceae bacterium]|nr:hypothetical protein [Ignavibacteriaceae bacterium]
MLEHKGIQFFPFPLKQVKVKFERSSKVEEIENFSKLKERRGLKHIDARSLNYFINGDFSGFIKATEDLIESKQSAGLIEILRTNTKISRVTSAAEEGKLFTHKYHYAAEGTGFFILIKIVNQKLFEEFDCEGILLDVFNTGYGKKKSAGAGNFEVTGMLQDFNEIKQPETSTGFMTLSNYLPSVEDEITNPVYTYFVKYGKLGEYFSQSEKPFKKPLILFEPGSCFDTNKQSNLFGRCTRKGEIIPYKPAVIQYGYAFSINYKH